MVVLITNITDAPGGKLSARQVDVYNKKLDPGDSTRIPAELVNKRVRDLEKEGLIAIGTLPSWYKTAKSHKGRRLTDEEKNKLIVRKPQPPLPPKKPISTKPEIAVETKKIEEVSPEGDKDTNRKR